MLETVLATEGLVACGSEPPPASDSPDPDSDDFGGDPDGPGFKNRPTISRSCSGAIGFSMYSSQP
jgi:hypothetical protein